MLHLEPRGDRTFLGVLSSDWWFQLRLTGFEAFGGSRGGLMGTVGGLGPTRMGNTNS